MMNRTKKLNFSEKRLIWLDAAPEFNMYVPYEKQILGLKALQKSFLEFFL